VKDTLACGGTVRADDNPRHSKTRLDAYTHRRRQLPTFMQKGGTEKRSMEWRLSMP
jgi:hypothetical protein